jgi:hypothetical protein
MVSSLETRHCPIAKFASVLSVCGDPLSVAKVGRADTIKCVTADIDAETPHDDLATCDLQ